MNHAIARDDIHMEYFRSVNFQVDCVVNSKFHTTNSRGFGNITQFTEHDLPGYHVVTKHIRQKSLILSSQQTIERFR